MLLPLLLLLFGWIRAVVVGLLGLANSTLTHSLQNTARWVTNRCHRQRQ